MEKFVTDLDKILDDYENDCALTSDFGSSGYNSLKTSSEFVPLDTDQSSCLPNSVMTERDLVTPTFENGSQNRRKRPGSLLVGGAVSIVADMTQHPHQTPSDLSERPDSLSAQKRPKTLSLTPLGLQSPLLGAAHMEEGALPAPVSTICADEQSPEGSVDMSSPTDVRPASLVDAAATTAAADVAIHILPDLLPGAEDMQLAYCTDEVASSAAHTEEPVVAPETVFGPTEGPVADYAASADELSTPDAVSAKEKSGSMELMEEHDTEPETANDGLAATETYMEVLSECAVSRDEPSITETVSLQDMSEGAEAVKEAVTDFTSKRNEQEKWGDAETGIESVDIAHNELEELTVSHMSGLEAASSPEELPPRGHEDPVAGEGAVIPPHREETVAAVETARPEETWQGIPLSQLGRRQPSWTPDEASAQCESCDLGFTVFRRRHHCRACGRLLCGKCCSWRHTLLMGHAPRIDRVCAVCFTHLVRFEAAQKQIPDSHTPTLIPPRAAPCGVLKTHRRPLTLDLANSPHSSSSSSILNAVSSHTETTADTASISKSVMFADGIKPGGDLSEIDRPRLITPTMAGQTASAFRAQSDKLGVNKSGRKDSSLIEGDTFPEWFRSQVIQHLASQSPSPLVVPISANLKVNIHLVYLPFCSCPQPPVELQCCSCDPIPCWCLSSYGLDSAGYEEVTLVLKQGESESTPPRDLLTFFLELYYRARQDETRELGGGLDVKVVRVPVPQQQQPSLWHEWPAVLLLRPSYQPGLDRLPGQQPMLVGILVHRWELEWALRLPLRLLLALGHQARHYPCPLLSDRDRAPVFMEPVPSLLDAVLEPSASGPPPSLGARLHVLPHGQATLSLPQWCHSRLLPMLSPACRGDQSPLLIPGCLSLEADSHLVCRQQEDEEGGYEDRLCSRAISLPGVGARPATTGVTAMLLMPCSSSTTAPGANGEPGTSIVEDVLVLRLSQAQLSCLVASLKAMTDLLLQVCAAPGPGEAGCTLRLVWRDDDLAGGLLAADTLSLVDPSLTIPESLLSYQSSSASSTSVTSHRVPASLQKLFLNPDSSQTEPQLAWTSYHIFTTSSSLVNQDLDEDDDDQLDHGATVQQVATAFGKVLYPFLDVLSHSGVERVGLRVLLEADRAEWSVGCGGALPGSVGVLLPDFCTEHLAENLVPRLFDLSSRLKLVRRLVVELNFHISP